MKVVPEPSERCTTTIACDGSLALALSRLGSAGHTVTRAHLRDGGSKRAKQAFGHEGYQYSHDFEGAYVPQAYLPEGRRYYEPSEQGYEKRVKERLDYWRALFEQAPKKEG